MKPDFTFARTAVGIAILRVIATVLSLGISIVLARALGPASYGFYTLTVSIITILALLIHAGLPNFLVREVARLNSQQAWGKLNGLRRRVLQWIIAGGASVMLLVWLSLKLADNTGFAQLRTYVAIGLPLIPVIALNSTRAALLRGLKKAFESQFASNLVQPGIQLAFLLTVIWHSDLTVEAAIYCIIFASFFAALVSGLLVSRSTSSFSAAMPVFNSRAWLNSLRPFIAISIVTLVASQVTILLLGLISSPEQVGFLRIAERVSQVVAFSLLVVNIIIAPIIAEHAVKKKWDEVEKLARGSIVYATAVSVPIALVLLLFGEVIMRLLFGAEFGSPAYIPLSIMVLGQLLNVIFGSVGAVLNMAGYEKETLAGLVIGLVSNSLVTVVLVPVLGAVGGAIGFSTGMLVLNLFLRHRVKARMGIRVGVL